MIDTRIKVALGLLIGVASVLGTAAAATSADAAVPATETRYQCDEAQHLVVRRTPTKASVDFIDRTYELKRRASDIGVKYLAPKAALIIDGNEAVFVTNDRLQLGRCVEAKTRSIALAR